MDTINDLKRKIESIQAENVGSDETGSNTENPINVSQLSALGLENLTPDQAKELLCLLQQTGSIPGLNNENDFKSEKSELAAETEEFNKCAAWGCRRKFACTTHGGKSNISSLWIHMQNAHRNAFVVFRRLKRPGFDKYCEQCQFWLKGAEWYNHRNLRRYQSEGNRPEGTYCDVYLRLADGLEGVANPLSLLDVKMCSF